MRKLKIVGVLLGAFIMIGVASQANAETVMTTSSSVSGSSVAELQAKIKILMQQIQALQNQLKTAQGGSDRPTPNGTTTEPREIGDGPRGNVCFGARGSDDVRALQMKLQQTGDFSSEVTGNFGPLTQEAVMKFQRSNGIPPAPCAGPKTREAMMRMRPMTASTTPDQQPKITPGALRVFKVGMFAQETLMAHGFNASSSNTWEVTNGTLPQGLSLSIGTSDWCGRSATAGVCTAGNVENLSGTPTIAGVYEFTIKVSDSTKSAERRYVLRVQDRDIVPTSAPATVQ